jgi:hypothetical protein
MAMTFSIEQSKVEEELFDVGGGRTLGMGAKSNGKNNLNKTTVSEVSEESSLAKETLNEHGNKYSFYNQSRYRFQSSEPYLWSVRIELLEEDTSM